LQCTFPTGSYDPIAGSLLLWLRPSWLFTLLSHGPDERTQTETRIVTSSMMAPLSATGETPPMKGQVPQAILDPILKEAAALAKVDREQLVIVRAESVIWSDGSLGCPEPGMMYTQALVNGYWVAIEAEGQTYDFRVGSGGSFRLCPPGQGHPPSQPAAN
jgi:hypothetical protein